MRGTREWRNWQTRTFEGRVVHTVRVQVPFPAPIENGWSIDHPFSIGTKSARKTAPSVAVPHSGMPTLRRQAEEWQLWNARNDEPTRNPSLSDCLYGVQVPFPSPCKRYRAALLPAPSIRTKDPCPISQQAHTRLRPSHCLATWQYPYPAPNTS